MSSMADLITAKVKPCDYEKFAASIGSSRASLYAWMAGRRKITLESAIPLAKKLGVTAEDVERAQKNTQRQVARAAKAAK